ncbi:hypothetical protein FRC16_002704 [Serendipita sp. 398]|nr:hypothetical protein FRC16_002704 [Serendipita sp. 398]
MALGNPSTMNDPSTLVAASAVAVAVILALLVVLAVLRARHAALQRRYARFMQQEYDAHLALIIADKPLLHSVLISMSCDVGEECGKETTTNTNLMNWNEIRPLCVAAKTPNESQKVPPTPSTLEVGVFIRFPRLEAPNVTNGEGSEKLEGIHRGNNTSVQVSDYDIVLGSSIPLLSGRSS